MHVADTLSRAFIRADLKENNLLQLHVHSVMKHYPPSAKKISEYKTSTSKNKTSQLIMTYLRTFWPNRKEIEPTLMPYYDCIHEIYEEEGFLFI